MEDRSVINEPRPPTSARNGRADATDATDAETGESGASEARVCYARRSDGDGRLAVRAARMRRRDVTGRLPL
ncbi:unnamed protein product, partial [Iphiclides podalirius]